MFKNYFKIAVRDFRKYKGFTFVNISGLAVGFAVCMILVIFVKHEMGYDAFQRNADRMVRLAWYAKSRSIDTASPRVPSAMAPALEEELPEVERAIRVAPYGEALFESGRGQFYEDGIYFVDSGFFEAFDYRLIRGDAHSVLSRPGTIVITDTIARKYFGESDPVGRTILVNNTVSLEVTGIVESAPANTHLQFRILASYPTRVMLNPRQEPSWLGFWDYTYLVLNDRASIGDLSEKLHAVTMTHMRDEFEETGEKQASGMVFLAQPVRQLHMKGYGTASGDFRLLAIVAGIGLLVLLIACVNYMNLSTARYAERAKEVYIRKAAGAHRSQLIRQFFSESVTTAVIAFVMALGLAELFIGPFNRFFGTSLSMGYADEPWIIAGFLIAAIGIGLASGSYPAFFLSSINATSSLSGARLVPAGSKSGMVRKSLVVFQFAVSVGLIVCSLIVRDQVDFMMSKNLGYSTEQGIIVPTKNHLADRYDAFRQRLQNTSGVRFVTTSSGVPTNPSYISFLAAPEGNASSFITAYSVGDDFFETMSMKIVDGRALSDESASDLAGAIMVNQQAVRAFGWEEALGKQVSLPNDEIRTVVGVVQDFHYESLRTSIEPVLFLPTGKGSRFVVARLQTSNISETLASVRSAWEEVVPEWPFEYEFIDENYASMYESERRLEVIFGILSTLAIGIACLGLFGLAAFTVTSRTKEIGIRKVLGASVSGLVLLLSWDFAKLVAVAFLIAGPLAYVFMAEWLDRFAYRTPVSWTVFALAGVMTLGMTVLTISFQSVRAACGDPIKSLRYE